MLMCDLTDEDFQYIVNKCKLYDKDVARQAGVHPNTLTSYKKKLPDQIFKLICIANVCGYDVKFIKKGANII